MRFSLLSLSLYLSLYLSFSISLSLSLSIFLSFYISFCSVFLFLHGALTKRPLFILFCQQPKRRGECPPMPLSKAHPLRDIHASRSRFRFSSTFSSSLSFLVPFSFLLRPLSSNPPFSSLSFCNSLFPSRLIAEPPAARTVPARRTVFPSVAAARSVSDRPAAGATRTSRKDRRSIKRLVRFAPTNVRRIESAR